MNVFGYFILTEMGKREYRHISIKKENIELVHWVHYAVAWKEKWAFSLFISTFLLLLPPFSPFLTMNVTGAVIFYVSMTARLTQQFLYFWDLLIFLMNFYTQKPERMREGFTFSSLIIIRSPSLSPFLFSEVKVKVNRKWPLSLKL